MPKVLEIHEVGRTANPSRLICPDEFARHRSALLLFLEAKERASRAGRPLVVAIGLAAGGLEEELGHKLVAACG